MALLASVCKSFTCPASAESGVKWEQSKAQFVNGFESFIWKVDHKWRFGYRWPLGCATPGNSSRNLASLCRASLKNGIYCIFLAKMHALVVYLFTLTLIAMQFVDIYPITFACRLHIITAIGMRPLAPLSTSFKCTSKPGSYLVVCPIMHDV